MMARPRHAEDRSFTLAYIAGSGRCGSTLLDLMLAGHPQLLSLGELSSINTAFNPFESEDRMVARFRDEYRSFWKEIGECLVRAYGARLEDVRVSPPRWSSAVWWRHPTIMSWGRRNQRLLSCAQRVSGAPIIVDASKRTQRLYLLRRSGLFSMKVIHLVRDGRAVVNSYVKRYNSFAMGLRTWVGAAVTASLLRGSFPRTDWLEMRYEDLAQRPEEELRRVCEFLGVQFDPDMLRFRSHAYLGIGGNPLTKDAEGEAIALDERWKRELRARDRFVFAAVGGWINRLYGYPAW